MTEEQETSLCDTESWKSYIDESVFNPKYVVLDSRLKQVAKNILDCYANNDKVIIIIDLFGVPYPGIAFEIQDGSSYYSWLAMGDPIHIGRIVGHGKGAIMEHLTTLDVNWESDDIAKKFYDFVSQHDGNY
jgi:hypothetical protein